MVFERAMVLLNGIMVKFSKDNGKMELKTGMVSGNHPKEITIKEIGNSTDSMEKVSINTK
jgi:hypothetical protein